MNTSKQFNYIYFFKGHNIKKYEEIFTHKSRTIKKILIKMYWLTYKCMVQLLLTWKHYFLTERLPFVDISEIV